MGVVVHGWAENGTIYWWANTEDVKLKNRDTTNSAKAAPMIFRGNTTLTSISLEGIDTSEVTLMYSIFSGCTALTEIPGIEDIDTSSVTNMIQMFSDCSSLKSLDLSNWNTAKVTSMGGMFYDCSGLTTLDVSGFKTDKVTDMSSMFSYCSGLISLDLSSFKTRNMTNMSDMFYNCSALQELKLTNFDTSAVTRKAYRSGVFIGDTRLSSLTIGAQTDLSKTSLPSPYAEKGGTGKWTFADQYNHDDACTADELMTKTASTDGAAGTWVAELADPVVKIKITFTDTTTAKNGLDGTFAIYSSNKEPLYCTTDAEGNSSYVITVKDGSSDEIESDLFVEGNYYLVQLSAPTGFAKSPDQAFTIASTDLGTTKTLAVTNTKQITMPQTGSDEAAKAMQLAALLIIAGVAVLAAGNRSTGRKS